MKLVAGLGNPGARYRATRHNVGFEVLDRLAARHGLVFADAGQAEIVRWHREVESVLLVKPLTMMNLSGEAIGSLSRYYRVETSDLLVVCDDVNLPLGRLRGRVSGSEGGHNGLKSIAGSLGHTEYARLRIGVGRGDERRDLADHVLARFEPDERPVIDAALDRAADAVETWLVRGMTDVMNMYNRASDAT